jgi:hypothetical protein
MDCGSRQKLGSRQDRFTLKPQKTQPCGHLDFSFWPPGCLTCLWFSANQVWPLSQQLQDASMSPHFQDCVYRIVPNRAELAPHSPFCLIGPSSLDHSHACLPHPQPVTSGCNVFQPHRQSLRHVSEHTGYMTLCKVLTRQLQARRAVFSREPPLRTSWEAELREASMKVMALVPMWQCPSQFTYVSFSDFLLEEEVLCNFVSRGESLDLAGSLGSHPILTSVDGELSETGNEVRQRNTGAQCHNLRNQSQEHLLPSAPSESHTKLKARADQGENWRTGPPGPSLMVIKCLQWQTILLTPAFPVSLLLPFKCPCAQRLLPDLTLLIRSLRAHRYQDSKNSTNS